MRYYLYLDRCFLRNLFSVVDDNGFDIEVFEYSVRKSNTKNNQISVDPCIENFCECEDEKQNAKDKELFKRLKDSNFTKKRTGASYSSFDSSTIETQRRYINIEDITEIKNNCFYHDLIKRLTSKYKNEKNRVVEEVGFIQKYNNEYEKIKISDKNGFFLINDKLIWFYNELLEGDIDILSEMACEIRVIGYTMNCLNADKNVIKAIGIYIE